MKKIQMVTTVDDEGIAYDVFEGDAFEGSRQVFHRLVEFGQDSAHRAGGYAFRAAAYEQERCAFALLERKPPRQGCPGMHSAFADGEPFPKPCAACGLLIDDQCRGVEDV